MKSSFVLLFFCSMAVAAITAAPIDPPSLRFTQVTTNLFRQPTSITHAGDQTGRLFITEQAGRVRIAQTNTLLAQALLDMTDRVLAGTEQGLLGLAFGPGFSTNGHFYVDYTRKPDGKTVISRFTIGPDPNIADKDSEEIILLISQPFANHKGGQLAFGPDGYLYIGVGDGGFATPANGDPFGNGQNIQSLLGKLLRIDVESGVSPYAIPSTNPFATNSAYAPEIWALGLRNPWRFSFDRITGDLLIADVGHDRYEEIDFQPGGATGGQNYGWSILEGPASYKKPPGFDDSILTAPISSYSHAIGASVIGGYVYRGTNEPRMNGIYFFGDFISRSIWGLTKIEMTWQTFSVADTPYAISTFGEDEAGKLYLADYNVGRVFRIDDSHEVLTPRIGVGGGHFIDEIDVPLTTATPGAILHYTTDYTDPTESDPAVNSGESIHLATNCILKVRGFRSDLLQSPLAGGDFNFQVATPTFSPSSGPITNGTWVTISCATPRATIYFATSGAIPNSSSQLYTGPFQINGYTFLRARGFKDGFSDSDSGDQFFELVRAARPEFSPVQGPITNGTLITMSSSTPGATIHFTLDDSWPQPESPVYTGPFPIPGNVIVKARAFRADLAGSEFETGVYPLIYVASPTFSPALGPVTNGTVVTITCATDNAEIHFTLDGSSPSASSLQYTGPLILAGNQTLQSVAFKAGFGDSPVLSTRYGLWSPDLTTVTTVAGAGEPGFVDGPAYAARFNYPQGVCLDSSGNIYVADFGNHAIRRIGTNGMVTTVAGNGTPGLREGTSTSARFNQPVGLCIGPDGDLFVADRKNRRIRRVTSAGAVTTFCGQGAPGNRDGPSNIATFNYLTHVTYAAGSFYVGSSGVIRKITTNGIASSVISAPQFAYDPSAAVDEFTNLFVVSSSNYVMMSGPGVGVEVYAGSPPPGFADGPRLGSKFPLDPTLTRCIVRDTDGSLYVSDPQRIRKIRPDGSVGTWAGSGSSGSLNGRGRIAQFSGAAGLAIDGSHNIYVADASNHRIRKIWIDTDEDGIPDALEGQGTPFTIGMDDRVIDSDHDGISNAGEYVAGTDPSDSQSFLALDELTFLPNGAVLIQWRSVLGKSYQVEHSDDLSVWHYLGPPVLGNGGVVTFSDLSGFESMPLRIYRVFLLDF